VDIADQIFNDFVHIVVHHCDPFAPRGAESLQHELYVLLYLLIGTLLVVYYLLQILVGLGLAPQEIFDLDN
jgi:hypothetical protein